MTNRRADTSMARGTQAAGDPFLAGAEAAWRLLEREYATVQYQGTLQAHAAHSAIENAEPRRQSGEFYRRLLPLGQKLASVLSEGYRRCLKLALAHPERVGGDPAQWALACIEPAVLAAVKEIREWTILACEGENQTMRPIGTVEAGEGQTVRLPIPLPLPPAPPWKAWRAPSWLFLHYAPISGIGPLKVHHVPDTGADGRLGAAPTRLILGGLRRVFLGELRGEIVRARDEELATAAAVPAPQAAPLPRRPNHRRGWELKEKLLAVIRDVLANDPALEGVAFCAGLDKRHAPPLPAWDQSGEWDGLTFKAAWQKPRLRKKIRRVRQEAIRGSGRA